MELPQQLLKQISLLIDKPIASKVTNQIHTYLLHQNMPLQKTILLLCSRYRSDLLLFLFQKNKYPIYDKSIAHSFSRFCESIIKNIMEYRLKITEVIQLYLLILTKLNSLSNEEEIDSKKILLQIGYSQLARVVVKQPNLETKQLLMKIMNSNTQYLYSVKHKKIIQSMSNNFLQIYQKYTIYIPSYVRMIEIILNIDYNSKTIINQKNPEKSDNFEQIFIDLSSRDLYMITTQTLKILQNTAQKTNHQLHKVCLKVLTSVAKTLNTFRIKQCVQYFKDIDILTILRQCQKFIGRKGTIDQARFCKQEWKKQKQEYQKQKILKSQKLIEQGNLVENKSSPILIENVIAATNSYRLKYEVENPLNPKQTPFEVCVANNYLKKKGGIGGGKTFFLSQKRAMPTNQKGLNNPLYDRIIDSCFDNLSKQLEYKSYVDPMIPVSDTKPKYKQEFRQQKQSLQLPKSTNSFSQYNPQQNDQYQFNNNQSSISSFIPQQRDDPQIEEINNLIDLAYSYKFS